ncbi:MAG: restriction endonuclease [Terracidiphilus sp.]
MPEELVIVLAIIVAALWVVIKIFGAVSKGLQELSKELHEGRAKYRDNAFQKKRAKLACYVKAVRPDDLARAERTTSKLQSEFERLRSETVWIAKPPTWEKKRFQRQLSSPQTEFCSEMNIEEIDAVLCPNEVSWFDKESSILARDCIYPLAAPVMECSEFREQFVPSLELDEATLEVDRTAIREKYINRFFNQELLEVEQYNQRRVAILARYSDLNNQIHAWNADQRMLWNRYVQDSKRMAQEELDNYRLHAREYSDECNKEKGTVSAALQGFIEGKKELTIARIQCILGTLTMPWSIPRLWEIDFDEEQHILIVEIALPDVVHRPPIKTVLLKSGPAAKPLNQTERKEFIPKVHPAILLRIAYELFRNDTSKLVKLLVVNGWVSFDDPTSGVKTKAYTASLMVEHHQFASLNLKKLDPLAAFQSLNGKSAGRIIDIIPIEPVLNLKRSDSRFVEAKEVLNTLDGSTNLAAMDWQDFEHLIRELFEKEFSGRGAEVKITQASRDRGVDAMVFDPDPIHGGKYVIQAKRYTNTVDVSAVRDLCAVVRKEGASRGILVSTSTYGADAYAFANNEPVTLLTGAELLGLLKKHGYQFRINLSEARRLLSGL